MPPRHRLQHDRDENANPVGYDHRNGTEPFPPGSPEWVKFQAFTRNPLHGSTNSQSKKESSNTDYREIRQSRPLCRRPKGLKMSAGESSEYAVVRCQLCEGCKSWARMLDQMRVTEEIKHPVWFETSDDNYERLRHRIKGAPYFTAPLAHERRAVIIAAGQMIPTTEDGETIPLLPVEDMAALLSRFDHQRDRTEGRSGRRVSTGGMRSRKDLEQEVYEGEKREPTPPEQTREVVGWFTPRTQDTAEAPEWLGKLCDSIGVEWERSPLGIIVSDTDRIDAALRVHKGRAKWRTNAPPPEPVQPALFDPDPDKRERLEAVWNERMGWRSQIDLAGSIREEVAA